MMAEAAGQPIEVLHVVGGISHMGGVMTFVKSITTPPQHGVTHYIWKHRDCRPPANSPVIWACEGAGRRTDVSLPSDMLGAACNVPGLVSWMRRHPNAILYAHSRMGMISAALASRIRKAPLLMHVHAKARRPTMYRRMWQSARAKVIFNSRQTCLHYGYDPAQSSILMPSILWPKEPDVAGRPENNRLRFVAAGQFVPCKNLHVIIDAFAQLNPASLEADLRLCGFSSELTDSAYQRSVVERARQNSAIQIIDWDGSWMEKLAPSDIFVHAGHEESFGIVILEAFASGCRLIVPTGTFLDDLPEPVNKVGIERVKGTEPSVFARAMQRALAIPVPAGGFWEVRKTIRGLFSSEANSARLTELYRDHLRALALRKNEAPSANGH
jgi:glycosyltransferase involved in cell wall biosynthesis